MKNSKMGLGYRAPFHSDLIDGHPEIGFLEIITENYLWDKGSRRKNLLRLRENYELSFHGVSLSLAAPEEHDQTYLQDLRKFVDEFQPVRVSDHLCWSSIGGHHWHDLLPFPYSEENLSRLITKVNHWQDALGRPLIVENLSAYMASSSSSMSEFDFLNSLSQSTGCKFLLDVNNMIVNSRNFGTDPLVELKKIDLKNVEQVHIAGFTEGVDFVIDTHSEPPHEATWDLWKAVCLERSDIPYMIEWDSEIPDFETVKSYLDRATQISRGQK